MLRCYGLPGRFTRPDIALPSQQTPRSAPQVPKRTGNAAAHWGPLFKAQVERCWKKPGGGGKEPIEVIFVIKLNRDGMIDEARPISITSTTLLARRIRWVACVRSRTASPTGFPMPITTSGASSSRSSPSASAEQRYSGIRRNSRLLSPASSRSRSRSMRRRSRR